MISALDEIDAVARCIEKGALDYFTKPFDPVLLQARVSMTLQIHRLRQDLRRADSELAQTRTSLDQLISSVVPRPLSEGFGRGERALSVHYPEVTAVVARLEGVDAIAARSGPNETIARFNETLRILERCSQEKGLQIVRVTERSYTAIAGAPEWREDHAEAAAHYALDILLAVQKSSKDGPERPEISVGLNTGALIAGVAGTDRVVFGMWGDAVTTADALAREARVGTIKVSAATCAKLDGKFDVGSPRVTEVPGHGHLRSYVLTGRKPSSAVL
jgi:adenylate cyclase